MSIYGFLKRLLSNPKHHSPATVFILTPNIDDSPHPRFSSREEAEVAKHLARIAKEAAFFVQHYGNDFNAFFYRPDFISSVKTEVLNIIYPDSTYEYLPHSHWSVKHPYNFPGSFYAGESDTCGTGPPVAPANVLLDEDGCEFVFRQPQNFVEFLCVVDAAAVEVLDSYSCDGNNHWTYQLCREWWRSKSDLIRRLSRPALQVRNGHEAHLYVDYLNGNAELDLKRYCYFLENGNYPSAQTLSLPIL